MDPTPPIDSRAPDSGSNDSGSTDSGSTDARPIDLDRVERDLDDVQAALVRLNDGDYWTDEVTGQPLPADFLADNPTARTVASPT